MTVSFIIIAAAVIIDQLTKTLAAANLKGTESYRLIEGVLHLTYAENRGAAFSILADHRWVFMSLSSAAIIAMIILLVWFRPENRLVCVSVAMMAGGGIGNMIDRIFLGYVVDFIDFTLINFAIFNAADSFISIGSVLLILCMIFNKNALKWRGSPILGAADATAKSEQADDCEQNKDNTENEKG